MGSQPKKVDFQDDLEVSLRPDFFENTPSRPFFLSKAKPLLGRPIFSFMYKDRVYEKLQLLSLMLQDAFRLLWFRVELVRLRRVCPLSYINQQTTILKRSTIRRISSVIL